MNGLSCRDYNRKILFDLKAVIAGYNSAIYNSTMYALVYSNHYKNMDNVYYKSFDVVDITNDIINVGTTCYCSQIIHKVDINFLTQNTTIQEVHIDYYYQDAPGKCNGSVTTVPLSINVNFIGSQKVNIFWRKGKDYKRSGNPGYIKGKPLISANSNSIPVVNNKTDVVSHQPYIIQYTVYIY
jgi:hypothetical protein